MKKKYSKQHPYIQIHELSTCTAVVSIDHNENNILAYYDYHKWSVAEYMYNEADASQHIHRFMADTDTKL